MTPLLDDKFSLILLEDVLSNAQKLHKHGGTINAAKLQGSTELSRNNINTEAVFAYSCGIVGGKVL